MLLSTCLQARWGWVCAALWMPCWQNWCDPSPVRWLQSSGDPPQGGETPGGWASPSWPLHLPLRFPHTASSSCLPWCERQMAKRTGGSWRNAPQIPTLRSRSLRRLRRGGQCRRTGSGPREAHCAAWRMSSSQKQRSVGYRSILETLVEVQVVAFVIGSCLANVLLMLLTLTSLQNEFSQVIQMYWFIRSASWSLVSGQEQLYVRAAVFSLGLYKNNFTYQMSVLSSVNPEEEM